LPAIFPCCCRSHKIRIVNFIIFCPLILPPDISGNPASNRDDSGGRKTVYAGFDLFSYYDLELSDTQTVVGAKDFIATHTITADTFEITSPGAVNFEAGAKIRLLPGFYADTGSMFDANIDTTLCGSGSIMATNIEPDMHP